jgi:hypothetical protein
MVVEVLELGTLVKLKNINTGNCITDEEMFILGTSIILY